MRKIIWILLSLILFGCQTIDCSKWYSDLRVTPVTSTNNSNQLIEGWFATDFLENEINFEITFYFSADGYEECKSKTMIHEIINDSISMRCDNFLIIDNDTIDRNFNLIEYFDISETSGHMLFRYKKQEFGFPLFEQQENTFYIEFTLSDYKTLKDSCVVKISQ